jgi:hypothetical protein
VICHLPRAIIEYLVLTLEDDYRAVVLDQLDRKEEATDILEASVRETSGNYVGSSVWQTLCQLRWYQDGRCLNLPSKLSIARGRSRLSRWMAVGRLSLNGTRRQCPSGHNPTGP